MAAPERRRLAPQHRRSLNYRETRYPRRPTVVLLQKGVRAIASWIMDDSEVMGYGGSDDAGQRSDSRRSLEDPKDLPEARFWLTSGLTRVLIAGQTCCLRHEVIPFRDARRARSRNSVVFDGGFVIAHLFK